jgi:hypothetical protein
MFPDPTLRWKPWPSPLEGLKAPPFVLDRGLWRGVLHLIVLEADPGSRAWGLEVPCQAYFAVEASIYAKADHGDPARVLDQPAWLKEAERSQLLSAHAAVVRTRRSPRHFAFVGSEFCYETLGFGEPVVRALASREDAWAWRRRRGEDVQAR